MHVLLAGCLLLGACSALSGDVASPTSTTLPVETTVEATPESLAFDSELAIATGTVVAVDLPSLRLGDPSQRLLIDLLYDGLVEIDPVSGTLVPAIATTWWPNADSTVWNFEIDTDRATAADVAASLDAAAERAASPAAIVLSAIETIDARPGTVTITLNRPDAGLPYVLAGVPFSIVTTDGEPTGEFVLDELDAVGATLLPRDPSGARISVWFEDDVDTRAEMLSNGTVDASVIADRSQPGIGSRFLIGRGPGGALGQAGLLQIVAASLEPSALSASGVEAGSITPRGFVGDAVVTSAVVDLEDPAVADAIAAFPRAVVLASADAGGDAMLRLVAEQLAAAGFVVDTRGGTPLERLEAWSAGQVDLLLSGWVAPSPSVDGTIWALLGDGSPANVTGWAADLGSALAEQDDAVRWAGLAAAELEAIESGYLMPLVHSARPVVSTSPDVLVRADGTVLIVD